MLKLIISFFLILISDNASFAWPVKILSDMDICDFYIIDSNVLHTGIDAHIQKITDGVHIYILKQINDPSMHEQFLLINDVIASTIGHDAGINVNEVFFIPCTVGKNLKMYPERAATLHILIPGKDLQQEMPDYLPDDFSVHQRCINTQSPWQQKWPLSEHQQGLIKKIIKSMSLHEDLPPIIALDIFVGNVDRSEPNIFYDKKNNHFYGIDQAAVFGKNLAAFAYERLNELIRKGYFLKCDTKIICRLREYRIVLFRLKERMKPFMIIQAMQELLPYLGQNVSADEQVQSRMHDQSKIVEDSYYSVLELISLLDQI
jgi:hypothetical protein